MQKKNILLGGGCILIAIAITIICCFGGEEANEQCGDSSPIGFFTEDNMPSKKVSNEFYYQIIDETKIVKNPKDINGISDMELEFCTYYLNSHQGLLSYGYTVETIRNETFQYQSAYTYYYGLKKYANLKNLEIPYIFDGSMNCLEQKATQIYVNQYDEENNFRPIFDLKRQVKSLDYFGVYAACSFGNMDIDLTFSLYKKLPDKTYQAYHLTLPVTINKGNGIYPTFIAAYFNDFGINENELIDCSMLGISYTIKSWDYTPQPGDPDDARPFMKLYEVLLPNSTWEKQSNVLAIVLIISAILVAGGTIFLYVKKRKQEIKE